MIELALVAWMPLTAALFVLLRPHLAATISLVFGVMLLPALRAIAIPVLPDLNQYTVPTLSCLIMTLILAPQRLIGARPGQGAELFIVAMVGGALITNLSNMDPQVFGPNVIPGTTVADTINDGFRMLIRWAVPFLLGRALIQKPREALDVLRVLAVAGLLYVPFVVVELRTGPLFHAMIYGSTPTVTTFSQSMKYGGYRPVVLMNHGLTLSGFMLYSTIAWMVLTKLGVRIRPIPIPTGAVTGLMAVVVAACKSRAVWLYGMLAAPMIFFVRPRIQMLVILVLAGTIMSYPFLRSRDLIPVQEMAELAAEYAGDQAALSFMSRIKTEQEILERTSERYLFGWGGWARHFVYDPVTGRPLSTMDGFWLMKFGEGGLFRFLCLFLFLLYPVVYAQRRLGRIRSPQLKLLVCGMSWIVVLRTFDLLPNSTVDPYLTFLGGAVCGVTQHAMRQRQPARRAARKKDGEAAEPQRIEQQPGIAAAASARRGSRADRPRRTEGGDGAPRLGQLADGSLGAGRRHD